MGAAAPSLSDRIFGCLVASAIGDAMGGPVELWDGEDIRKAYGEVDRLLPYRHSAVSEHGPWGLEAGCFTDDTRMARLFCEAMLACGGMPTTGDLARTFAARYHGADSDQERGFLEEYYLKHLYRDEKRIFGGQPTNGAIMGIAPFGAVAPCDPDRAFRGALDALATTEGYARHAAAMAAAAVSAAMIPGLSPLEVVEASLQAVARHKARVDGPLWRGSGMYAGIARKSEQALETAVEIALRHGRYDDAFRTELLGAIRMEFFADGAETLALALACFVLAEGDPCHTIRYAVNLGRDNDSSACVAGAVAGAYRGAPDLDPDWIRLVEAACPPPSFRSLADGLLAIVRNEQAARRRTLVALDALEAL